LFASLREPPRKGSLRESVLLLYCLKKEDIMYMRDLALAQIQVSKEKGAEAFNEYRKVMFPWVETAVKRDDIQHKELLERIVKAGPLSVRPMEEKKVRSRLITHKEVKGPMTEEQRAKQNELYSKLGKTIPI
jgi:hypothetical protein